VRFGACSGSFAGRVIHRVALVDDFAEGADKHRRNIKSEER
jgi:hypothetical protein